MYYWLFIILFTEANSNLKNIMLKYNKYNVFLKGYCTLFPIPSSWFYKWESEIESWWYNHWLKKHECFWWTLITFAENGVKFKFINQSNSDIKYLYINEFTWDILLSLIGLCGNTYKKFHPILSGPVTPDGNCTKIHAMFLLKDV